MWSNLGEEDMFIHDIPIMLLPPWQMEVMFLVTLVSLSVCGQHFSKSYERICMKFYGWVLDGTIKN